MKKSLLLALMILICFTCFEMRAEKVVTGNINYLPGDEVAGVNTLSGRAFDFYVDRTLVTNFPVQLPDDEIYYGSPVLYNIDNDPYKEIFILSKKDNDEYFLHCIKGTGQEAGGFPRSLAAGLIPAKDFVVGDIDDDEIPDVVFGDNSGNLKAYNLITGSLLFDKNISTDYLISPALFDLDNDEVDEIIAVSGEGKINTYKFDYSDWPTYYPEVSLSDGVIGSPVIYKENNIVKMAVATVEGKVYLFQNGNNQWNLIAGFPVDIEENVLISPAVGDFDNDNEKEIAVFSFENVLYLFEQNGEIHTNHLNCSAQGINKIQQSPINMTMCFYQRMVLLFLVLGFQEI